MDDGTITERTDTIILRISYDRPLWRTAMTGWWQSVAPPAPFVQRAIFWSVVWTAVRVRTLELYSARIGPDYVLAGLIGVAFLIGVFGYLQRTRIERPWDVIGSHLDEAAIVGRKRVTILRSGISMAVATDTILPAGLDPKAFCVQLRDWKSA